MVYLQALNVFCKAAVIAETNIKGLVMFDEYDIKFITIKMKQTVNISYVCLENYLNQFV